MNFEKYTSDGAICLIFAFAQRLDADQVNAMAAAVEEAMGTEMPLHLLLTFAQRKRLRPKPCCPSKAP